IAVDAAAGRVPVIVGIGHSTRVACQLAQHAHAVGADGLLVHPFYFVSPPEEGIVAHYAALAQASPLGLIVYHTREAVYGPGRLCARAVDEDGGRGPSGVAAGAGQDWIVVKRRQPSQAGL